MSGFYLWIEEQQQGPVGLTAVQEMLKAGQISPHTLWRRDGDEKWLPLKEHSLFLAPSCPRKSESSQIRQNADIVMRASSIFFILGTLCLVVGLVERSESKLPFVAAFFGVGFSLCLVGQLLHIRSLLASQKE